MYKTAYKRLLGHEGGYTNHPADRGGETYKGVARNFHPHWHGWDLIDSYKNDGSDFPACLADDEILDEFIQDFYKDFYWDELKLDNFPSGFGDLQYELFDTAVNMGWRRSAKLLQRSLNILNRDGRLTSDIKVDGLVGNKTLAVVDKYKKESYYLFKLFVLLKAKIYIDILEHNPSQEAFARGWINRITLNKN